MNSPRSTIHEKPGYEIIFIFLVLALSFHLVQERIEHARFPGGDEGSWMSAAAQLSRGEGYTTRWYEHPFLRPATLPRPDDYRYPGMVTVLAAVFYVFGISYVTALWTVGVIFFLFLVVLYGVCVKSFNAQVAAVAITVAALSFLQLYWNTVAYSEGLFGLVAGALIFWTQAGTDKQNKLFWVFLGAGCGLLYCVRSNGVLFGAGIVWLYITERKNKLPASLLFYSLASMALIMLPWMLRNWHCFGNPFHIAAGAGLLRGTASDPMDLSIGQVVSRYGLLFPLRGVFKGFRPFWTALNFFEHGLQILPLAGAAIGVALRRRFYNSFATAAILCSFAASLYACTSAGSWAGLRYFSSLLPFVYGYGIAAIHDVTCRCLQAWKPSFTIMAAPLIAVLCCAPVFYPHKYYERTFCNEPRSDLEFSRHLKTLGTLLGKQGTYCAESFGQLNFLTRYNCVGMQRYFDSSCVKNMFDRFSPTLIVLTKEELRGQRMEAIIREIKREGHAVMLIDSNAGGLYFGIR